MNINLDSLGDGIMGLTQEFGNFLLQACAVCLDNQNHSTGVQMNLLTSSGSKSVNLNWNTVVNSQVKRNWSDLQEATEYGATALAIKLAESESTSSCIERSSKGTGFDYWLGDEDDLGIFQRKERMEISGILKENGTNTIERRVKVKSNQTKTSSSSGLNAHICVVEFSNPKGEYKVI
ncbi:hypothetical protein MAR621_00170 [Maribacter dokdonensis]|uniref:hypothetical protein n=1 Tax=Maribacter dokdonensis TaxID=320912 RepID=UPI001B256607|nr:hypothetical protein [Maribacter dokdonensis]CAG2535056.1 hypothetical protein MAR621_00170 [Maribacter dokdonensis]